MKKYVVLILVMCYLFACTDSDVKPEPQQPAEIDLTPKLHMSFDHEPSSEEIHQVIDRHRAESKLGIDLSPDAGNAEDPNDDYDKLVILTVRTMNLPNAGTDQAADIRFIAKYNNTNGGSPSIVNFILNRASIDDLERGATNVFVYGYETTYGGDQLYSGRLRNYHTDGWLCDYVRVAEESCNGQREYLFTWGNSNSDWVQTDGNPFSIERYTSGAVWLYYTGCPI